MAHKPYEEKKVVGKFRVLHGRHAEGGGVYKAGDVVDSKSDLRRMNAPGSIKFELVGSLDEAAIMENTGKAPLPDPAAPRGQTTEPTREDDLDSMTVQDLVEYAEMEDIDLRGAKRKEDILKAIRSSSKPAT